MKTKIMFASIGFLYVPFLIVPALVDETYWFLAGASEMNFSASNILSYGASFDQPGRYMPLSGFLRAFHSYLGFEIMTNFGIPLIIFEGIVHACFIATTFALLYWYLINLPFTDDGGRTVFLDNEIVRGITILTAFIFGGLASVRWKHNGLIAYVPMTYLPLISALLISTLAVRILLSHKKETSARTISLLITMSVLTSLWANIFYELAYVCIVLVSLLIAREFFRSQNSREKRISLLHLCAYIAAFLAYWIPLRIHLAKECATTNCYEGSQLALETAFSTFGLNLINPLPLIGPYLDFMGGKFVSELSIFGISLIMSVSLLSCILIYSNFRKNNYSNSRNQFYGWTPRGYLFSIILGPASIGIISALLMSVSIRSQRLVEIGNPYRHTPILWLGYSLILASLIYLIFTKNSQYILFISLFFLTSILMIQQLSSFNNSLRLQKSHNSILKIYDEVVYPDYSDLGNERRCSLVRHLNTEKYVKNYITPSSNYFSEVLNHPYCVD
jgi:hypothetical protein